MARANLFVFRREGIAIVILMGMLAMPARALSPADRKAGESQITPQVQAALQHELDGHNDLRQTALREAVERAPDNRPAHWQLGEVRMDGQWLTPEQAEEAARTDPRLQDYFLRRDNRFLPDNSLIDLAKWCHKEKLVDEERAHWMEVLQWNSGQRDAIKGLGLQSYQGNLLTKAQISQLQVREQRVLKEMLRFGTTALKWSEAMKRRNETPPDIKEKVSQIADSVTMLGVEQAMQRQFGEQEDNLQKQIAREWITLLEGNSFPAASESLARMAVFSAYPEIRDEAGEALKRRPLDHFVPLLLSGLQSPIEVSMQFDANRVGALVPSAKVQVEGSQQEVLAVQNEIRSLFSQARQLNSQQRNSSEPVTDRQRFFNAEMETAQVAEATKERIGPINSLRDLQNSRITQVLRNVSNKNLGSDPQKWYDWWWREYNESYSYQPTISPRHSSSFTVDWMSCFAPGTKVWTLLGRRPIEQIQVGDRVLAQDVETGEVAYKPVLSVTTRPPAPRIKISVGADTILATRGHPFWAIGKGWQMSKQLDVGTRLHALSGGFTVTGVEDDKSTSSRTQRAHNLVVADFNTYFVGDRGFLVHDNTPRQPTACILPGLPPSNSSRTPDERTSHPITKPSSTKE